MADSRAQTVLGHLNHLLASAGASAADGCLLERFVQYRDEDAFAELVARHGPLVFGLCRRLMDNLQDAEDVFQATFLVLACRGKVIRKPESLSCWLHGVAYRLALKAKSEANRRCVHEKNTYRLAEVEETDLSWREVRGFLDEELQRLPEKQRLPLVLCYLEGLTQDEASRKLGWPRGTLKRRLEAGRDRLRHRLTQRGVTLGAGLFAVALTKSATKDAVSTALVSTTVRASIQFVSQKSAAFAATPAALLAKGALQSMFTTKLKIASAVLLLLACAGFGASQLALPHSDPQAAAADKEADRPKASDDKAKKADDVPAELRAMRGTWISEVVTETSVVNGEPQPPRKRKIGYVISDNKLIQLGEDGTIDEEWTIRLDPSKRPKTIDLTNPRYGTLLGIYRLEGDSLKIRYSAELGKRSIPSDLEEEAPYLDLTRTSRTPAKAVERFPNEPGCYWMTKPESPGGLLATGGIVYVYETDKEGAALVTLAAALPGNCTPEYRPVLLDAAGKRHLPKPFGSSGSSGRRDGVTVSLQRWRMDPTILPADKVARMGIEGLTPEYHQSTARSAFEQARKEGVEVLSVPEVGKTFDFVLTKTDGKKIRSRDLRGKVVLIDCWATWCSPCRALLPELKELYEKSHKDGLEIVGISFDQLDAAKFQKVIAREGLSWPQVIVPSDEKTRRLWGEITGIGGIPRLFLIDRQGILRADNPAKLKEEVARLLSDNGK